MSAPITIDAHGCRYVRLDVVVAHAEGEQQEQLRRMDLWAKDYGRETSVACARYAAVVVRDLGSALIEEYGTNE